MLSGFLTQCMKKAEEKKYTSIGFAAIGSGLLRYPLKMIAKTMYDSVIDYSNSNPNCSIKNVSFVIYPSDTKTIKVIAERIFFQELKISVCFQLMLIIITNDFIKYPITKVH